MEYSRSEVPELIAPISALIVLWVNLELLELVCLLPGEVSLSQLKALLIRALLNRAIHAKDHVQDDVPVVVPKRDKRLLSSLHLMDFGLKVLTA